MRRALISCCALAAAAAVAYASNGPPTSVIDDKAHNKLPAIEFVSNDARHGLRDYADIHLETRNPLTRQADLIIAPTRDCGRFEERMGTGVAPSAEFGSRLIIAPSSEGRSFFYDCLASSCTAQQEGGPDFGTKL